MKKNANAARFVLSLALMAILLGCASNRSLPDKLLDLKSASNVVTTAVLAADKQKLIPAESKPIIKGIEGEVYDGVHAAQFAIQASIAATQPADVTSSTEKAKLYIRMSQDALGRLREYLVAHEKAAKK